MNDNIYKGQALVAPGDHVNADTAMGWYIGMESVLSNEEIAAVFMQNVDKNIAKVAKAGDILVCGRNFGYGKVNSPFMTAVKTIGIKCFVAESFSTQMYTNLRTSGIMFVECPGIMEKLKTGDEIEVNFSEATIKNVATGEVYQGNKPSDFIREMMLEGGIMPYLKKKGDAKLAAEA